MARRPATPAESDEEIIVLLAPPPVLIREAIRAAVLSGMTRKRSEQMGEMKPQIFRFGPSGENKKKQNSHRVGLVTEWGLVTERAREKTEWGRLRNGPTTLRVREDQSRLLTRNRVDSSYYEWGARDKSTQRVCVCVCVCVSCPGGGAGAYLREAYHEYPTREAHRVQHPRLRVWEGVVLRGGRGAASIPRREPVHVLHRHVVHVVKLERRGEVREGGVHEGSSVEWERVRLVDEEDARVVAQAAQVLRKP